MRLALINDDGSFVASVELDEITMTEAVSDPGQAVILIRELHTVAREAIFEKFSTANKIQMSDL